MTRKISYFFAVALLALMASHSHAAIRFNEIYANPVGTDDNREFIELISTTGGAEPMTGLVLLSIDANGGSSGGIDEAFNLNNYSTGTNGLLAIGNDYDVATPGPLAGPWNAQWMNPAKGNQQTVLKDPSGAAPFTGLGVGDLSNNAFVALLVSGFTGAAGQDLDTNDDGIFETTPWGSIVDSIAWNEGTGTALAGRIYGMPSLSNTAFTPDSVSRLPGNFTPNSAAAWFGGDLASDVTYDPVQNFALPPGAVPTPTYANIVVPEPSTWILGTMAGLALMTIRRKR
jgi:hypothetical protein